MESEAGQLTNVGADATAAATTALITAERLPPWDILMRLFPLATLVAILIWFGYFFGRRSLREFIDYLLKQLDKHK